MKKNSKTQIHQKNREKRSEPLASLFLTKKKEIP